MTRFYRLFAILGLLAPLAQAAGVALPLHSSSRWILDANSQRVKFRCVNWAGHMEANIPEGLQHQSVDYIADWIAKQGFNCVRLTYSIDHALNPSLTVSASFAAAAAAAGVSSSDMAGLYTQIVAHNPWITNTTTTRDVFGAVIDALFARGVMTILDNHVSKASWCCNLTDGNGWWDTAFGYNSFNSRYFHTADWLAGLQAMASWAASSHPGVVAMSLRNELRAFLLQGLNGRADWYKYVQQAGDLVHATHPDVLVIVGGVQSATDLTHLRDGVGMLDTSGWAGKHVWEMHAYSFTVTFPDPFQSCDLVQAEYGAFVGFVLEQGKPYTGPLILSEFGVGMQGGPNDGLSDQDSRYLSCLVSYMQNNDADWAVWAVQGSYYVRDRTVDADESWGLLTHDWSDWRNPAFPGMLGDMWKMTQQP
ncbi:d8cc7db3-39c9-4e7d-9c62-00ad67213c40 [Thermothielavioides terrestris]|uniref:Glycoside hydrolase family 5 protein n=2 Tax=Thermothielavioides terrestris TaxID=2587410 RepID=G2R9V2_THETT|nr:glycoside hydrolase family 5 protein [Thermothielavioides terrestris NRRL 8126]AEO69593.1 glycoside hydrolase family 5 protein [Thermothielavioides terrestris NRRL 8126]SPQ26112.1 d8cc7db3-39c9-4e7d-9c62-00ad67213c40 [Thermothielavioides terrestris]